MAAASAQLIADYLQVPAIARAETGWALYQPRRLGLPDAGPVPLGTGDPVNPPALAEVDRAVARLRDPKNLRQLPPGLGAPGLVRRGGGSWSSRAASRSSRTPTSETCWTCRSAWARSSCMSGHPRPRETGGSTDRAGTRPAREGPATRGSWRWRWRSVQARGWRGKTLVLVADSHFEDLDKAGRLLANYTGCPVVTATRQVWARDRVLVAASAAIRRGEAAGWSWRRRRRRTAGWC